MKRLSPNPEVYIVEYWQKQLYSLCISPTNLLGRRPNFFMSFMLFMVNTLLFFIAAYTDTRSARAFHQETRS